MNSSTLNQISILWNRVLQDIQESLNNKQLYDAFFKDTYIYGVEGNKMIIVSVSNLGKNLFKMQYYELIKSFVDKESGTNFELVFLSPDEVKKSSSEEVKENEKPTFFKSAILNPSYTFDNFVVGVSNNEANQAALICASSPAQLYNPLFIYGGSGLGKTHLLNAIGNYVKEKTPVSKILYITAQDFLYQYLEYVNSDQKNEDLSSYLKSFDILLLDDIQMLKDKKKTLEFFFDIYQYFLQNKKQVVLSSDKMPSELEGMDARLITRFMDGLTVQVTKPDQLMCEEILKMKIQNSGLELSLFEPEVISFVASKFKNSIRELNGALNRIIFIKNIQHTDKITLKLASDALANITDVSDAGHRITEQKILNAVSSYYNLSVSQITGKLKTSQIVTARHIAIYLIRNSMDLPLKKIGEIFSNRDHTTIMHSIEKVDDLLKTDPQTKVVIKELKNRING